MNIKKLFLAWQNPETRCWFPIGVLTFDGEYYDFRYSKGVKKAKVQSEFQLLHLTKLTRRHPKHATGIWQINWTENLVDKSLPRDVKIWHSTSSRQILVSRARQFPRALIDWKFLPS